ncbi:MAG: 3-isopropylmalate dehydrogenase [Gammaproteobacteria bacterium]|jgi:3-isopropylmalate dehydrogenase
MKALIAVLPGDGIGPEVCRAGAAVLAAVGEHFGHAFELREAAIGGAAIDATGKPLPPATEALCRDADAVLLGAVGGPKWSDPNAPVRPEQGLLQLRQTLGVFANLRPIVPDRRLSAASPLRGELLEGVDICFVRELTGGIYFGAKRRDPDGASDVCSYSVAEIERVVRLACELALTRKRRLVSVDKANVLETSRLWREITDRIVAEEFPAVSLEHMLVDAAAMYLIQQPRRFDVVVTENMFGDILTDEASVITGSLGMLPSASLSTDGPGLYEPIHGSAPDIAGKGIANPFGTILSGALLLRHSLGLEREARAVERAVSGAIDAGLLTPDLAAGHTRAVSTTQAAAGVVALLKGETDIRAIA